MKKVLRFTAMTALLFTTSWTMANEPLSVLVSTDASKGLVIKWDASFKMTTVKIFDSSNNVIFSDNIVKKENKALKFNLEKLEIGIYTLKIESFNKVTEYGVRINRNDIEILEKKEISKPIFSHKDKKLVLNFLNADGAPVYLKVYDSENRILFKETLTGNTIGKVINFESAFEDSYTVMLIDENTTYSELVVIK